MATYVVASACPPASGKGRQRSDLNKLRFASWNIRTLTGKFIELVKVLHRRKISKLVCRKLSGWVAKLKRFMGISCGTQA